MSNLELFDMIVLFIRSFLEQSNVAKLTMEQEMKISMADQLVSVLEECSPELKIAPLEEKLSLVLKGFMSARKDMYKPPTPKSDSSDGNLIDLVKFFAELYPVNPQERDLPMPEPEMLPVNPQRKNTKDLTDLLTGLLHSNLLTK